VNSCQIQVERLWGELAKYADPIQTGYEYIMRLAKKVEEKQFTTGNLLTIVATVVAGSIVR